jgi:predicted small lipoprotein YifL
MVDRILDMRGQGSISLAVAATKMRWRRHAALWVLLCLASGCGQKGPLTLPSGAAKAASAPASR